MGFGRVVEWVGGLRLAREGLRGLLETNKTLGGHLRTNKTLVGHCCSSWTLEDTLELLPTFRDALSFSTGSFVGSSFVVLRLDFG